MEQYYARPEYLAARNRVERAITKFKAIKASKLALPIEDGEELMVATYNMAKVLKESNGFVAEKTIPDYTIEQAVDEVEYQFEAGAQRDEAAALEVLSRIIFRTLPHALADLFKDMG